jgi:arsenate reductase
LSELFTDLVKAGLFCPQAAKWRVLYVCTGNSCRSQIAEGWPRMLLGYLVEPCSAGVELHPLDPGAVSIMAEAGVDISRHRPQPLDELRLNFL